MLPVSAEMPSAGLTDPDQGAPEGLLPPSGPTDSPTFAHLGQAAPTTHALAAGQLTTGATDLGATDPGATDPGLPAGVQQETRLESGGVKEGGNPCASDKPVISTQRETPGGTESPTLQHTASRRDLA